MTHEGRASMTVRVQPQLDPSGPLTTLLRGRAEQRAICDDLEMLADQLGGPIDRRQCLSILDKLAFALPLYHDDEEALYRILSARKHDGSVIAECVDQAIRDHRYIEDNALEVTDAIEDCFASARATSPETLGYLLRCAFEGLRRHMAWEDVTLLGPLLRPLTHIELDQLQAQLARNRSSRARHLRIAE